MSIEEMVQSLGNPRVLKSLIAAEICGYKLEEAAFEWGVTNKSPEFLEKFPLGKVPCMETPQGPLFESDAIFYYVMTSNPNALLLGQSPYEAARVMQYVAFAQTELMHHAGNWYFPIAGFRPHNPEVEQQAKEGLKRALAALDKELLLQTFLVGERLTGADIACASVLQMVFSKLTDAAFRQPYQNVLRWFETVVNQPAVKKVFGKVEMCTKTPVYSAEKKPAEPVKKPEAKPAATPAADEEDQPKEEKKKNPLDLLPPSNFNMDAWKRFYSNNDPPAAIDYFWQNFDQEGYSMWDVKYKYNDELALIFQSSNLIGGFFQRLDRARKYAFGSMIVTGENNKNEISGMFIFRGQEVPFEVTDAADYDSYVFTKVNVGDEQVKKTWNDYLSWEGQNLPGKFADGKIFK